MPSIDHCRHPLPRLVDRVTLAKGKAAIRNRVVIPAKLWADSGLSGSTTVTVESYEGHVIIKRYEEQEGSE